jgi:RimJ/RimL family protein N-acetyltransferase
MMDIEQKIQYTDYDSSFCEKSWDWLNDEEIRYLADSTLFSREDQTKWFAGLSERSDYYIRGVLFNKIPIGSVGLKKITKVDGEYWGYIGEKEYWGQGIGKSMVSHIVDYAIMSELRTIYLNVRKDNERAMALYKRAGFLVENLGVDRVLMRLYL